MCREKPASALQKIIISVITRFHLSEVFILTKNTDCVTVCTDKHKPSFHFSSPKSDVWTRLSGRNKRSSHGTMRFCVCSRQLCCRNMWPYSHQFPCLTEQVWVCQDGGDWWALTVWKIFTFYRAALIAFTPRIVQKPRNQSWCFLVPLQAAFLCNLSRSQLCRADERVTERKHRRKTFLQFFVLWLNISAAFWPPRWIPSIPQIMGRCSLCHLSLTVHRQPIRLPWLFCVQRSLRCF